MNNKHRYMTIFGVNAGKNGKGTLRFNDVTVEVEDNDGIHFTYVSASTGDTLRAEFPKANIGISYPVD